MYYNLYRSVEINHSCNKSRGVSQKFGYVTIRKLTQSTPTPPSVLNAQKNDAIVTTWGVIANLEERVPLRPNLEGVTVSSFNGLPRFLGIQRSELGSHSPSLVCLAHIRTGLEYSPFSFVYLGRKVICHTFIHTIFKTIFV